MISSALPPKLRPCGSPRTTNQPTTKIPILFREVPEAHRLTLCLGGRGSTAPTSSKPSPRSYLRAVSPKITKLILGSIAWELRSDTSPRDKGHEALVLTYYICHDESSTSSQVRWKADQVYYPEEQDTIRRNADDH